MLRSNTRTGAKAARTPAARTRKENATWVLPIAAVACDPGYWLMLLQKGQVALYRCTQYLTDAEGLAGLTIAIVKTAQNNLK
jgi:hypothetical protein